MTVYYTFAEVKQISQALCDDTPAEVTILVSSLPTHLL